VIVADLDFLSNLSETCRRIPGEADDVWGQKQQRCVDRFRNRGVCLLRKGVLEDYLPAPADSGRVEDIVEFVSAGPITQRLPDDGGDLVAEIVPHIIRAAAASWSEDCAFDNAAIKRQERKPPR